MSPWGFLRVLTAQLAEGGVGAVWLLVFLFSGSVLAESEVFVRPTVTVRFPLSSAGSCVLCSASVLCGVQTLRVAVSS